MLLTDLQLGGMRNQKPTKKQPQSYALLLRAYVTAVS